MKKQYLKPGVCVERYALTQSISACSGIKINSVNTQCVLDDIHSTNMMLNLAHRGGFLGGCSWDLSGSRYESICYHTNVNAAFTS